MTAIIKRYYWSGLQRDVDETMATCARCIQFGTRLQRLLLQPILRFAPFELVAMDFLHMPKGSNRFKLILVAIDCFTRYIVTWPLRGNPNAGAVVKALDDLECRFVAPKELLLDTFFDNRNVKSWAEK